ncbi:SCO2322 family protein [Streptomyces sp. NPDC056835]|uniref:SCO2322 family protein n=1 Tax=Streptomyces sp. NPDC056835 TaxID=3345956 RepID=UPI0036CC9965
MIRTRASALIRTFACLVVVALGAVVAGAGTSQAAGYRYWSFWESDGATWTYATQGPATARPADGAVNGFRFAVSADSGDADRPRETPDFAAVCGATPARDGHKRIAVVIDSGTDADAPGGEKPPALRAQCARVGEDATSAEALAAVAKPLRYNSEALLCAIAGYPASGCGEQVAADGGAEPALTPQPTWTGTLPPAYPTELTAGGVTGGGSQNGVVYVTTSDDDGPSFGLFTGIAAVVVLAAAAFWRARRVRE